MRVQIGEPPDDPEELPDWFHRSSNLFAEALTIFRGSVDLSSPVERARRNAAEFWKGMRMADLAELEAGLGIRVNSYGRRPREPRPKM